MKTIDLTYVVEDDPIALMLGQRILQRHPQFVASEPYANGRLALDAIEQRLANNQPLPDLILLDLSMPVMDGWEFLEAFNALPGTRHVAVVICTSSIDPADIARAKTYPNVLDFVSKPLLLPRLDEILKKIVE